MSSEGHLPPSKGYAMLGKAVNEMIHNAPLKVYVADFNSQFWCPFRLVAVNTITPAIVKACGTLILDSGIRDPDIGNQQVIDTAVKYGDGVDFVVPKDYPNDRERTVESIKEFFELAPPEVAAKAIIPVQGADRDDYVRCYEETKHLGDYFGFGGIAGSGITKAKGMQSTAAKIDAVKFFLDSTDCKQLHLFGQTNLNWKDAYRDERIISCDSNTFGQKTLRDLPRGKGSGSLYGWLVMGHYLEFVFKIGDGYTPLGRNPKQKQFGDFFG